MIKIEIIRTAHGWNYRNSESKRLVGTVNEHSNRSGVYMWEHYDEAGFTTEEDAHRMLRATITRRAHELGVEVEFVD